MTVDANICAVCRWSESGNNVNPYRKKCPNCGALYGYREEVRFFDRISATEGKAE